MCEFCSADPRLKADGELVESSLTPEQRETLMRLVNEGMVVVGRQAMERAMLGRMTEETRKVSIDYLNKMQAWKDDLLKNCEPEVAEVLFRRLPSLAEAPPK